MRLLIDSISSVCAEAAGGIHNSNVLGAAVRRWRSDDVFVRGLCVFRSSCGERSSRGGFQCWQVWEETQSQSEYNILMGKNPVFKI